MSLLERFSKWIKLKIYQIEVTYSVYIFTPAEKFVFYTAVFLLFSLTSIAIFLYLPRHIAFLINRAWFYVHGEGFDAESMLANAAAAATAALKNSAHTVTAKTAAAAVTDAAAAAATAATEKVAEAAGTMVREL